MPTITPAERCNCAHVLGCYSDIQVSVTSCTTGEAQLEQLRNRQPQWLVGAHLLLGQVPRAPRPSHCAHARMRMHACMHACMHVLVLLSAACTVHPFLLHPAPSDIVCRVLIRHTQQQRMGGETVCKLPDKTEERVGGALQPLHGKQQATSGPLQKGCYALHVYWAC